MYKRQERGNAAGAHHAGKRGVLTAEQPGGLQQKVSHQKVDQQKDIQINDRFDSRHLPFRGRAAVLAALGAACSVYANGKEKMRETCES